jgi:hypothetical protein
LADSKKTLTTESGTPVPDNQNSQIAGNGGPTLLQDQYLIEKLARFNRERIPERIVHAVGTRGDPERLPPRGRLDGLEIPVGDGAGADERGDLLRYFRLERRTEPPFSRPSGAASARPSNSASATRSQAIQYSSVASRNCRPASIWRRTVSTWSAAIRRVCVVPSTDRVRLK